MELPEVAALNALSASAFVDALAPLFEGAPRFLDRLAGLRPFASDAALLAAARTAAASAPEDELTELLKAHPRIGATPDLMSDPSRREQDDGASGTPLVAELAVLNVTYEARFGFRYVVFVAGRPRSAIAPLMRAALHNDRASELRRGADDAISIAEDRLARARAVAKQAEGIGS